MTRPKRAKRKGLSDKRPVSGEARLTRGRFRNEAAFPVAPGRVGLPRDYASALAQIKKRIQQERLRVVLSVNSGMVRLYWDIGRVILDKQEHAGRGAKVIDRLAADLRDAYPDMQGFSPRNLKYMRAFAAAWPDTAIVQRIVAQLPWRQNIALLEKLDDEKVRLWYAQNTIKHGWSQPVLLLQIQSQAHRRHGKALNLSAADDLLRHEDDKPSIGLLLCRSKNKIVVDYALRNLKRPIGVAEWETQIVEQLPENLKGSLPSVEEIEAELEFERRPGAVT